MAAAPTPVTRRSRCREKRLFMNTVSAHRAAEKIFHKAGKRLYPYKCNACGFHHLTKTEQKS